MSNILIIVFICVIIMMWGFTCISIKDNLGSVDFLLMFVVFVLGLMAVLLLICDV